MTGEIINKNECLSVSFQKERCNTGFSSPLMKTLRQECTLKCLALNSKFLVARERKFKLNLTTSQVDLKL